jgi:hypothetical protein
VTYIHNGNVSGAFWKSRQVCSSNITQRIHENKHRTTNTTFRIATRTTKEALNTKPPTIENNYWMSFSWYAELSRLMWALSLSWGDNVYRHLDNFACHENRIQ